MNALLVWKIDKLTCLLCLSCFIFLPQGFELHLLSWVKIILLWKVRQKVIRLQNCHYFIYKLKVVSIHVKKLHGFICVLCFVCVRQGLVCSFNNTVLWSNVQKNSKFSWLNFHNIMFHSSLFIFHCYFNYSDKILAILYKQFTSMIFICVVF